jgi:hypothetical protein
MAVLSLWGNRQPFFTSDGQTMKRPEKSRVVKIILVSVLLLFGLIMIHVDVKQSDITATSGKKTFIMERSSVSYAAETEKQPAGDYKGGEQAKETTEGDLSTRETRDYVTPLRIISVIAMSIFLVWYIRRKLKL